MSRLKQFIHEIHRRSLWQVLMIYLGASWAVMEATNQIVEQYLLPEWVYPAALILLLIGFPIVLATAFVREDRDAGRVREIRDPTLLGGGTAPPETTRPGVAKTVGSPLARLLSWRRAMLGGVLAFTALGVVSAWVVIRGTARVTEAYGAAGEAFGERAWIVVAEFEALESEREIALAAQTALSIDLTQSRYVNVRGRNQIVPVLRRMGLSDTTKLDETIALEIAQREGMAAVLVPAVARLGGDYVFSARVIQPGSGAELIAVRTAARAERLLEGVEALSRELRSRLGEASEAIRQSRPLPEVTTSSLEALRMFALAKAALEVDLDRPRAAELALEATRLDTSFAMAYRLAAVTTLGGSSEALEYSQRAYELRDRLTDRERMHVEAIYYFRQYDMQRGAEVYDALLAQYPDDDLALNNLGVLTGDYLGDYERAYRAYHEAMALNPYSASRYGNAINAAYKVDRLDVADSLIAVASARGFEEHVARWSRRHAVALGDFDRADALCDSLLEEAASAARFADRRSSCGSISAARGRIGEAIDRMEAAGEFYGEQQMYLDYPNVVVGVALAEQIRGQPTAARARLEAALDRFPPDSIREFARVVYRTTLSVGAGLLGYTDLQERFAETYPEPSGAVPWTVEYADAMASAARSLAEGDPESALAALREIDALGYELSGWLPHAHLMHALAFEELGDLNAEVVSLEQMIHPSLRIQGGAWEFITLSQLPFALRRLAELEEARGDTEAAIEHYRQFLDLWSDPDPELRDQVTLAQRALEELAQGR